MKTRATWMIAAVVFLVAITSTTAQAQQWETSGNNIYYNAGTVGIGTTSPGAPLDVFGTDDNARFRSSSATGNPFISLYQTSTLRGYLQYGNGDTTVRLAIPNGALAFYTGTGSETEKMRIASGGNVGIGTTSPGAPLDVFGTDDNARFRSSSATGNPFISLYQTSTLRGYLQYANSDTTVRLTVPNGAVAFYTGTGGGETERMRIAGNGNVGIGTTNPGYPFEVFNPSANNFNIHSQRYLGAGIGLWTSTAIGALYTTNNFPLELGVNGNSDIAINTSHNVGIGTTTPATKLHVAGSITVDGNISAKYQDVAEWVQSSEQLAAGTVVVLDSTKSNQVISSSQAYDTRVAGVISAQPGITLGEKGEGKVLVATTGRVRIKVDAAKSPIRIGDLLVTSDIPGVAMKSEAVNLGGVNFHRPGTLIGKALEPLEKGQGEILVLLSLQ